MPDPSRSRPSVWDPPPSSPPSSDPTHDWPTPAPDEAEAISGLAETLDEALARLNWARASDLLELADEMGSPTTDNGTTAVHADRVDGVDSADGWTFPPPAWRTPPPPPPPRLLTTPPSVDTAAAFVLPVRTPKPPPPPGPEPITSGYREELVGEPLATTPRRGAAPTAAERWTAIAVSPPADLFAEMTAAAAPTTDSPLAETPPTLPAATEAPALPPKHVAPPIKADTPRPSERPETSTPDEADRRRLPTWVFAAAAALLVILIWVGFTRRPSDQPILAEPSSAATTAPVAPDADPEATPNQDVPTLTPTTESTAQILTVPPSPGGTAAPDAPAETTDTSSGTAAPDTSGSSDAPIEMTAEVVGSENDEFVRITNNTGGQIDLGGWSVFHDGLTHLYRFDAVELSPGASVTLYSGCGQNEADALYWCSPDADVWSDDGDIVTLVDADQTVIARVSG